MASPLRILVAGGWNHATSRGNRLEAIYRSDTDRRRFLDLVMKLPERFGAGVHAFVLIDNHNHPVVRTIYVAVRYGQQRLADIKPGKRVRRDDLELDIHKPHRTAIRVA
jgi:putative transposase